MKTAVVKNQELEAEINALHSTLEEAVNHLKRVDDRMRREIRLVRKVTTYDTQNSGELISNVAEFRPLFDQQFDELRLVIETNRELSSLINDYDSCLKGGV